MAFGFLNQILGQRDPIVDIIPSALGFASNIREQNIQKPLIKAQVAEIPQQTAIKNLMALASLQKAQTAGQTDLQKQISAFNASLAQDQQAGIVSPTTRVLAAGIRKAIASPAGTTITTTPQGGTTVQLGGLSQNPAVQASQQLSDTENPNATPHSTINANDLLFPPTETSAQQSDQKQLGDDIKSISSNASDAQSKFIPLYEQTLDAINKAGKMVNPITGHILWTTPEGQELNALLSKSQGLYFQQFHNIRNQREFNTILKAVGNGTMYPSALSGLFKKALDASNSDITKQAFYNNYIKNNGNSSTEALNAWIASQNPNIKKPLDQKLTDFVVPGTNHTYQEFIDAANKNNISVNRLISEAKMRGI